jgi:hypothetical protein
MAKTDAVELSYARARRWPLALGGTLGIVSIRYRVMAVRMLCCGRRTASIDGYGNVVARVSAQL